MAKLKMERTISKLTRSSAKAAEPSGRSRRVPDDSYRQLRAVLDTAVDGIILIDERGVVQTFNLAAQRMFDYPAAEVIGRNVSVLMPSPYGEKHDGYIANYLRTGQAKIIGIGREARGRKKDGTIFPIELAVSESRAGKRRTFTGIVRDLSERKRLEREILEASEREQRKIGRDLHDGLCQELAGIAFLVQSMERNIQARRPVAPSDAAAVAELLQAAVRHARELSHGLYPVAPEPNGLSVALEALAASTSDLCNVACAFRSVKQVEIRDASASTHVYRIAQEAVRDAVRRGNATRISIDLARKANVVQMKISDNGARLSEDVGLRADNVLWMMQHRAKVLGAKLHVDDRQSGGVRIICEFPDRAMPQ